MNYRIWIYCRLFWEAAIWFLLFFPSSLSHSLCYFVSLSLFLSLSLSPCLSSQEQIFSLPQKRGKIFSSMVLQSWRTPLPTRCSLKVWNVKLATSSIILAQLWRNFITNTNGELNWVPLITLFRQLFYAFEDNVLTHQIGLCCLLSCLIFSLLYSLPTPLSPSSSSSLSPAPPRYLLPLLFSHSPVWSDYFFLWGGCLYVTL